WTAYALRRADPSLEVVVLEREHVGFGASGRNGGWVLGELSTGARLRRAAGPAGMAALRRAIEDAVDDVVTTCAEEGIDCDLVKGGTLTVAQTVPEHERLLAGGHGELLDAAAARARVTVAGLRGARYFGACARVQPAKLVAGLAAAAERRGVVIHERTPAVEIAPGRVRTARGTVRAPWVVRATEGYTA